MVFLLQRHLTPNLLNLVILSCSFGIAYVIMSLVAREVRLNDLLGLIRSPARSELPDMYLRHSHEVGQSARNGKTLDLRLYPCQAIQQECL